MNYQTLAVLSSVVILGWTVSVQAVEDEVCETPDTTFFGTYNNFTATASNCALDGATVLGNVQVETGGDLSVSQSTVIGNIEVDAGGGLFLNLFSTVGGYVESIGATRLLISESVVSGYLLAEETSGPCNCNQSTIIGQAKFTKTNLQRVSIGNCTFGGDLKVRNNDKGALIIGNTVAGKVRVAKNEKPGAGPEEGPDPLFLSIGDNVILGNLNCTDNTPDPYDGGGNSVDGNAKNECANFALVP